MVGVVEEEVGAAAVASHEKGGDIRVFVWLSVEVCCAKQDVVARAVVDEVERVVEGGVEVGGEGEGGVWPWPLAHVVSFAFVCELERFQKRLCEWRQGGGVDVREGVGGVPVGYRVVGGVQEGSASE